MLNKQIQIVEISDELLWLCNPIFGWLVRIVMLAVRGALSWR